MNPLFLFFLIFCWRAAAHVFKQSALSWTKLNWAEHTNWQTRNSWSSAIFLTLIWQRQQENTAEHITHNTEGRLTSEQAAAWHEKINYAHAAQKPKPHRTSDNCESICNSPFGVHPSDSAADPPSDWVCDTGSSPKWRTLMNVCQIVDTPCRRYLGDGESERHCWHWHNGQGVG